MRFRFGPIGLQPEAMVTTRGASASAAADIEQMRLDHIEIPLLLVLPARIGRLEPFVLAGPSIILESRCRYVTRRDGVRTTVDCDPPSGQLFDRPVFDWGVIAGAGAAHPLFGGSLSLEARHLRGLRDIHNGPGTAEVYNRSWAVIVGYSVNLSNRDR